MKKSILFLSLYVTFISDAQNIKHDLTIWDNFTDDLGHVFKGVGYTYSRPLYWGSSDYVNFGLVSGSTLAIYSVDTEISKNFIESKENIPDLILRYGWYAGSPQINYAFTGSVYLTGLLTKNKKIRRVGILLLSSNTASGLFQQVTKSITGRARPGAQLGKNHFRPFGGSAAYRSFPSGHSVLTFTTAHVIAKQFDSWWIKIPIYSLGIIPGLTRIYEGAHWMSDVILSWSISFFMVESVDKYLVSQYDNKYKAVSKRPISTNLIFTGNTIGFSISF